MKKVISFVIALAVMVSAFMVPAMAFGSDYFDAYQNVAHNGSSEYVFWFDAQDFVGQVSHGGAFRGAPYVGYLRDYSTPKGISGDESDVYWGVDGDNVYMIMNDQTRWTNDNCISDAYTFTIDVQLEDGFDKLPAGGFDTTAIPNVADRFAGVRMYTNSDSDAFDASASSMTPGASGIGFNVNVADNTKDQLIIYVMNSDKTATSATFDLANGTFDSWTTLKVDDDLAGNMVVSVNGQVVAKLTIATSSVTISNAAGSTVASTTKANLYNKANFHVVNLNNGFLNIDNIGVKAYGEGDDTTDAPATDEPTTAPSYEEVETVIDIATLPSAGTFTAAGYTEDQKVLNIATGGENDGYTHSLGVIDLSAYDKLVITYGTDASATAVGTLILKGASNITSAVLEPAKGWTDTTTSATFDISAATNNEEIFLVAESLTNGLAVNSITLVELKEAEGGATTTPTDAPATDAPATDAPATDAPATQAPTVPTTVQIDISKLPTCGDFKAAGYPESQMVLNFFTGGGNDSGSHSIGVVNLANFNTMTISYATDSSAQSVGKLVLQNAAGDTIASVDVAPCTTGWRQPTTLTIDVSAANNNEELFLHLTEATNGMVVTDITLNGETTDTDNDTNDTGDVMSFAIVIAAAALLVTGLSKKRSF